MGNYGRDMWEDIQNLPHYGPYYQGPGTYAGDDRYIYGGLD